MTESIYQKVEAISADPVSQGMSGGISQPDDLRHSSEQSAAAEAAPLSVPHLVLRPGSAWHLVDLAEVWYFRDLLFSFAGRDLKLRYKQTALGIIWVILHPLMAAGVFTLVGSLAKLPSGGIPTFVFMFASMLAWNLFSNTLGRISTCMVSNSNMISKVYFPRIILPLSITPSTLVDFSVGSCLMAVLMIVYHIAPGFGLLLIPLWVMLILLTAVGFGMIASALAVSYRDIQYILPVLVQTLMFASPVIYPASAFKAHHPALYPFFCLNPLSGILTAFRWSIFGKGSFPLEPLLWSVAAAVIAGLIGLFTFKRLESRFADVI